MINTSLKPSLVKAMPASLSAKHHLKKTAVVKAANNQQTPFSLLKSFIGSADPKNIEFRQHSEKDTSSYDVEAVKVIRSQNIDRLKEMHSEGRSMNACNQFGESLVHMVCRRADVKILKFMIEDAKVSFAIRDDFGRNPFHDACWTPTPNFAMMDMLIEAADTCLLLAEDVRGNTPFDYARREHYGIWISYLENNKDAIMKGLHRKQVGEST